MAVGAGGTFLAAALSSVPTPAGACSCAERHELLELRLVSVEPPDAQYADRFLESGTFDSELRLDVTGEELETRSRRQLGKTERGTNVSAA